MSHLKRTVRRTTLLALFLAGSAVLVATPVHAQAELKERIAAAMVMIGDGAREVLEEELMLSDEQAAEFWPLYDQYASERREIGERYVRLVGAYLDRYQAGTLTDNDADIILNAFLSIEQDTLDLRKNYVDRFREILPGILVARFFQLENKVRAEVDRALALAIPLADPR